MTTGIYGLQHSIEQTVEQFLKDSNAVKIGAHGLDDLGLDFRCGKIHVSVDGDFVAVSNPRDIEYYGGWEYIDSEFKFDAGDYRFYDSEASRVDRVIQCYRELLQDGYRYEAGKGFVNSNGLTQREALASKSATAEEQ
tara:strand:+ start:128 stop:541 length:414 start_codon:yes stop_codon:yes gene_type:complete